MAGADSLKRILVLNTGSSSLKLALFAPESHSPSATPLWETTVRWPGGDPLPEVQMAEVISEALSQGGPPHAVAHRVVHGGEEFTGVVRITPAVLEALQKLAALAPLHQSAALQGIALAQKLLGPAVPQFAAFDTAFHATLPQPAALYPGPYAWWEAGIRRYGFHGISHRYCAEQAARFLGKDLRALRIITCHLGSGCSLAAIQGGQSIDTTMGFTPLDGLMMGTRTGSVDPGILLHLLQTGQEDLESLTEALSHASGLKGVSGVSGDMREVIAAMEAGNARARLAFETFVHRLRWHIGALLPALGGLDALVFTAGIGENCPTVRSAACAGLEFLSISVSREKNYAAIGLQADISAGDAPVRVLVIPTQEAAAIAADCALLLPSG